MPEPEHFGARAWAAYMHSLCDPNYYMAIDELATVCMLAHVRVAIFKTVNGTLLFEQGSFDGDGPMVCVKLGAGSAQKEVRSHFERLVPWSALEEFTAVIRRTVSYTHLTLPTILRV